MAGRGPVRPDELPFLSVFRPRIRVQGMLCPEWQVGAGLRKTRRQVAFCGILVNVRPSAGRLRFAVECVLVGSAACSIIIA